MNFNDKFLNVCFKLGKIIFSFLLLLALVITVLLWVNTGIKAVNEKNIHMTYQYASKPVFDEFAGVSKPEKKKETSQDKTTNEEVDKALEILAKFAKDKDLPSDMVSDTFIMPTDEKEVVSYVNGFIAFYDSFLNDFRTYAKNEKKVDDKKIDAVLKSNRVALYKDILNGYVGEYQNEYEKVNNKKLEAHTQTTINLTAALISLAIFILFLFLPILIRIEENTRK